MEDALVQLSLKIPMRKVSVLILVLMEDALVLTIAVIVGLEPTLS